MQYLKKSGFTLLLKQKSRSSAGSEFQVAGHASENACSRHFMYNTVSSPLVLVKESLVLVNTLLHCTLSSVYFQMLHTSLTKKYLYSFKKC